MGIKGVGTYSPDNTVLTWGPIIFTGFAKGSFIKLMKPDVPQVKSEQGGDGEVARVLRKASPLRRMEATLLQTTLTNDQLAVQAELDRNTGAAVYPLQLVDLGGTSIFSAAEAWIEERPEQERAQDQTNRVWVLAGIFEEKEGGNPL
jgi:hypothetical protein